MSDREDREYDARVERYYSRRARRFFGCLCAHPDMPGRCPGAANCPLHGENLNEESHE